jgi:hypothetical protein
MADYMEHNERGLVPAVELDDIAAVGVQIRRRESDHRGALAGFHDRYELREGVAVDDDPDVHIRAASRRVEG